MLQKRKRLLLLQLRLGAEPSEADPPSHVLASRPSQTQKRKPPSGSVFQDEPDESDHAFQDERPKSRPKATPSLFQDEGDEQAAWACVRVK